MAEKKDSIRNLIEQGRRAGKLTSTEISDAMEESSRVIDAEQMEKLYEELLTKEEGLQKTANDLIFIGKPLEFDEVHFLSQLRELEKAAMEESPDIKEKVAGIIPTYHIRPEDKKRDSEAFQELVSLGRISHEGPSLVKEHMTF